MDDVASRIEHTVLGPTTTTADAAAVVETAADLGMRACLAPCHVAGATDRAPDVDITAVVGFPHGQHTTATKCTGAVGAWSDGAAELDVVADIGAICEGEGGSVRDEVAEVVAAVPVPVKVIVEAPLLEEAQLRLACEAVADAGADFLKTATGFSEGGATVADVDLMSEYLPVKASGGIGSWDRAEAMFDAGAERIGASSGDVIVREYRDADEGTAGDADGDSDRGDGGA